ncbi:Retrovirus-related Pol polyprotein from transposon TNT 1-94 [Golovinomyces cichoracearum]|uniref:Retrovirus-related Pol polyprotein from transposon TNT 1-94 n=1 Tax=Golovinomyces cichoracearum TaxID=62708 RepID=A0A420HQJ3_9PEZI|nr:Retrovirus-related Pol polyprotein from transposon TNT 1-94 [Golovinomyces cichoracearum]
MSSERAVIPKLAGSKNYAIWALRMKAHLIDRGYKSVIATDEVNDDVNDRALAAIHLFLDDGPLLQIQNEERAHAAWNSLKSLYSPSGFSADFLVLRELFKCKLKKFDSMEEFLNTIKRLRDDLKTKGLDFPHKYYYFWVLNNLTPEYEMLVLSISQGMRGKTDEYDLDSLFANLIDESKRLGSLVESCDSALLTSLRGKFIRDPKPRGSNRYKVSKQKFCRHCKTNTHETSECFKLFPNKAPKGWRPKPKTPYKPKTPQPESHSDGNEQRDILISQVTDDNVDFDMDRDFNVNEVFITTHLNNSSAEYILGIENTLSSLSTKKDQTYSFVLDTAATSHIICDKSYFANFKTCRKIVKWGNAKSMVVNGVGDVYIRFKGNEQLYAFRNCLYMPEIGVNIISQSQLKGDKTSIFNTDTVLLKSNDKFMAKGKKINNLYYLEIEKIVHPKQLLNVISDQKVPSSTNGSFKP